ncbi:MULTISPECIES: nucleotide exchange factor GrpE [unclassified Leptolyngbya]|uniref:helix-turn-helix domain-containing protein n=1 Tax=unclassified Leptolyngbya TaxID=2650499 RepID=UPI001682EC30|nr:MULTISPECIES: nucleotide exchange factor GrpE [unclassified Leptolyngbya]MBD1913000.1 nucleotide exchange factor GrpE [Leptolyngbya sp. FACHB-8]MBD2152930.1 nucleotide exchange factor GrpE [Leptolyngbya sp. FACHB-16]
MNSPDFSERLRSLLEAANIPSFRALCRKAEVSKWQVEQLRRGQIAAMRVENLQRMSEALGLSLTEFISHFSSTLVTSTAVENSASTDSDATALQEEYQRLQAKLEQQREQLLAEFQQATLQTLESMLVQLPTALYTAQQKPDIPASRLAPLLRPLDQLLSQWGIESIAPVGSEIPYDPQQHQLMEGNAQPGDQVRVRYMGYVQGDRLLYRAKVSPV